MEFNYVIIGGILLVQLLFSIHILPLIRGIISEQFDGSWEWEELPGTFLFTGLLALSIIIPLGTTYLLYLNPFVGFSGVLRAVFWGIIIFYKFKLVCYAIKPKTEMEQWGDWLAYLVYFGLCIIGVLLELGFYYWG
ncbi:MAG: hypothetical protein GY810_04405 [Aureispira sp.]|nr:hypothetical protein [Aureispira sp.]